MLSWIRETIKLGGTVVKDNKVDNKSKERDLSDKNRFEILLEDIRYDNEVLYAKLGDGKEDWLLT